MMTYPRRYFRSFSVWLLLLALSGCASLDYYSQSISGQLEVFHKTKPIVSLLEQKNLNDPIKARLKTVLELRQFSIDRLGLPDNNSYFSYADLERDYVIWNIFATEEFSLQPITWCYLIVGCLTYRGYFSEEKARQHARTLKEKGYDTFLGGVAAYSTLGWFNDPVLNTMLRWDDVRLAKVIFHELAHQQIYVKNDTEFNEAYADAIALIGVRTWLTEKRSSTALTQFEKAEAREEQFIKLVMRYKSILEVLYESEIPVTKKRIKKAALFNQMRDEYDVLRQDWDSNEYESWFDEENNNAKLTAVVTYRKHVPAFLKIYEKTGRNLKHFFTIIRQLSLCDPDERDEILNQGRIKFGC